MSGHARGVELRDATEAEWLALAEAAPSATFFHTPMWARVATVHDPRARSRMLLAEGDGGMTGIPFVEYGLRHGVRVVDSSFARTYGGPISSGRDPPPGEPLLEALASARTLEAHVLLPTGASVAAPPPFQESTDVTHVFDLTEDLDSWRARWSKAHRQAVRRAERAGVTVELVEDANGFVPEYHAIYRDTVHRWGERATAYYGESVFRNLVRDAGGCAEFWVARLGDAVASAMLLLTWRDTVVAWHSASRREFLKAQPNNLLRARVPVALRERGFRVLDLNPSGGFSGVVNFKESLGATPRVVRRLDWRNGVLSRIEGLTKHVASAIGSAPR